MITLMLLMLMLILYVLIMLKLILNNNFEFFINYGHAENYICMSLTRTLCTWSMVGLKFDYIRISKLLQSWVK